MSVPAQVADDYRDLRQRWVAHRLARDVVTVEGPEAEAYLQGQLSQDVAGMAAGSARDGLLLEPDGKLTALVRATRVGTDGFALDVDAGFGDVVEARLRRFRLRTKVDLARADWPCIALRGPAAPTPEVGAAPPGDGGDGVGPWVLPVTWAGLAGVDVLGPGAEAVVPADARWCGDPAWDVARIEAGVPVMGRELDGRTIAAEADLLERAVSFTKGCYTGQELVARLDARGNRVPRHLRGLVAADDVTLAAGTELFDPETGKGVGRCTSAGWSPGLRAPVGLGYVHRSVAVPGRVAAGAPDGEALEVRPLPLV